MLSQAQAPQFRKFSAPLSRRQVAARVAVGLAVLAFTAAAMMPREPAAAQEPSVRPVQYITLPRVVIEGKRERVSAKGRAILSGMDDGNPDEIEPRH